VQNLKVSDANSVDHFARQSPGFLERNVKLSRVGQNQVELLVRPHWEFGSGFKGNLEQIMLGVDAVSGATDNLKEEKVLLVPHGGQVRHGKVKRLIHQFPVLIREAANRCLELWKPVSGP